MVRVSIPSAKSAIEGHSFLTAKKAIASVSRRKRRPDHKLREEEVDPRREPGTARSPPRRAGERFFPEFPPAWGCRTPPAATATVEAGRRPEAARPAPRGWVPEAALQND